MNLSTKPRAVRLSWRLIVGYLLAVGAYNATSHHPAPASAPVQGAPQCAP